MCFCLRASWLLCFFFFKQKTAYELRISDWSSDVCSSDLIDVHHAIPEIFGDVERFAAPRIPADMGRCVEPPELVRDMFERSPDLIDIAQIDKIGRANV